MSNEATKTERSIAESGFDSSERDREIREVFVQLAQEEKFDQWLAKRDIDSRSLGVLDASTFLSLSGFRRASKKVRKTTAAQRGLITQYLRGREV